MNRCIFWMTIFIPTNVSTTYVYKHLESYEYQMLKILQAPQTWNFVRKRHTAHLYKTIIFYYFNVTCRFWEVMPCGLAQCNLLLALPHNVNIPDDCSLTRSMPIAKAATFVSYTAFTHCHEQTPVSTLLRFSIVSCHHVSPGCMQAINVCFHYGLWGS